MAEATDYVDAGRAVDQAALTFVTGSAPPVARNVTYERILRARSEPHNWLTYYGAYDGQRYSPLEQINTQNVRRLTPAWVFQCGATGLQAGATTYAFEAAPVVVEMPVMAKLSQGSIAAVASQNSRELAKCEGGADLKGEITVRFEINAAGRVTKSQVSSTLKNPKVTGCILMSLRKWQFPRPSTGAAEGTYTMSYQ